MQKLFDWFLLVVFGASLLCIVLANPEPLARDALCAQIGVCSYSLHAAFWNNLIYEVSLGAGVSIAFYWLLVKVPEAAKRKRLRRYLLASYKSFRTDSTYQFLFASGLNSVSPDLVEELASHKEFRGYFKQPSTKVRGDRWHDVANGLEPHQRRELFLAMSMLRDDVLYILNNTDIADQESFDFLHRLTKALASHDPRSEDYDEDKMLLGFFWSLMAGWNPIKGYESEDPISRIIQRI
jgi:hypothetical protein